MICIFFNFYIGVFNSMIRRIRILQEDSEIGGCQYGGSMRFRIRICTLGLQSTYPGIVTTH